MLEPYFAVSELFPPPREPFFAPDRRPAKCGTEIVGAFAEIWQDFYQFSSAAERTGNILPSILLNLFQFRGDFLSQTEYFF